jgi:PAS domain S-box-containing protein
MTSDAKIALLQSRINALEAAQARSSSEWEETVDAMSDWVCIIDPDFRIVRTNRAVEDFLGMKREEVLGRTCYEIVHGTGTHIAQCPVPPMVKSLRRAQEEVQLPDGRWLTVTADPLTDEKGRLTGAVHMVRDITALKKIQTEREALIRKLEKALSEVRTLKGLIPICAKCQCIRDDSGAWSPLEAFVRNNLDAEFSHGLCPACAKDEFEAYDL